MRTPQAGSHELFAFLTCEPNAVVKAVHPKAMPLILTSASEVEAWLTADWGQARELQRPLAERALQLVTEPARQA